MSVPCAICGNPCPGKAHTCSPVCRAEVRRRDVRRYRERCRGGPRRCVACGQPITAPTATKTCSEDCRRAHRLGRPLAELPPLVRLATEATCDVCGRVFAPTRPQQKGCSAACQRAGRLRRKLARCRKGPYPPRSCIICGQEYGPQKKNQRTCARQECQAQHKRDLASARTRGQLLPGTCRIFCTVCGAEVLAHPNTLTCAKRECVLERRRQVSRRRLGIEPCACIVCGERFWPPYAGQHYTCSDRCQSIARMRRNHRTYEAHRTERLAEQAERVRTDPAYRRRRQEIDREYRRRRAAREALTEVAALAAKLEKRHGEEE